MNFTGPSAFVLFTSSTEGFVASGAGFASGLGSALASVAFFGAAVSDGPDGRGADGVGTDGPRGTVGPDAMTGALAPEGTGPEGVDGPDGPSTAGFAAFG